jgi:hypothetical protein
MLTSGGKGLELTLQQGNLNPLVNFSADTRFFYNAVPHKSNVQSYLTNSHYIHKNHKSDYKLRSVWYLVEHVSKHSQASQSLDSFLSTASLEEPVQYCQC